jgi:phosphoglycolate phosphatase
MKSLEAYLEPYEHVIWDWNGTLLSDVDFAVNTVNISLKKRNLPLIDRTIYQQKFCFPIKKYYQTIGLPTDAEQFDVVCNEFVENFMKGIFDCSLNDGAREILAYVKEKNKMQSILSATDQTNLDRMMTAFKIRPYLDHVFGIENIYAAGKVHRGHQLVEIAKKDPKKTVLVGDTDHDLEVGKAIGVSVILLAHGHQTKERLDKIHDVVIEF